MIVSPRRSLFALALLGTGCGVLDRPYVETLRFPLAPERPGSPPARGGRRVVQLRLMRAGPGLDSRGLRTLRADGTVAANFYAEWIALPAEAAEEALRRWLIASRRFAAVVAQGTRARADLVLETELTTLQAEPARGIARATIAALLLSDAEGGGTRVLGQWPIEGTAPLADDSAAAVALACQTALGAALAALEAALTRHA